MGIDRRITSGLAWAGLVLVVGVPAADLLSEQFAGASAPAQVAMIEPAAPQSAPVAQRPAMPAARPDDAVAVAAPAKPAAPVAKPDAARPSDAVDAYLQSGRPLPSYITGGDRPAAVAAAPVVTPPAAAVDPTEVAAIAPQREAPMPMPLSMRPAPVDMALGNEPVVVIPPGLAPATSNGAARPPVNVTADDLENWETGPLSEFLAQRQQQAGAGSVDPSYDADGFFLDEGPNRSRARVIAREVDSIFFAD